MDNAMIIEIFGYIGSALVVISMLMSSIVKLRIINTVGSVISGIYAVICGAIPLAVMNICLITINIYGLVKLLKIKQIYDLVIGEADDALVGYFLNRYENDIKSFFPEFEHTRAGGYKAYIVCFVGNPAGVMLGRENDGVLDILIDYSTPVYRDCSVGAYLYSNIAANSIHTLRFSENSSEAHISYMKKMGFVQENGAYINKLA